MISFSFVLLCTLSTLSLKRGEVGECFVNWFAKDSCFMYLFNQYHFNQVSIWRQKFFGHFWPTYPHQILYYITLFFKIMRLDLPTYPKIWRHMYMLPWSIKWAEMLNQYFPSYSKRIDFYQKNKANPYLLRCSPDIFTKNEFWNFKNFHKFSN